MTLPQNVKDAVRSIDDSETVAATPHPDCNALVKIISVDDWQTIRAHLMSQEAELADYKNASLHADDDCVAKDAEIARLQSRLAVANALLRTIAAYTPPAHECARGCPKETCEACKLAKYLQGAGDEGGRPA